MTRAQSIAGRAATPDEAQRVSDEAHDDWRKHMDRDVRDCLEKFLAEPDSHTRARVKGAMKAVLRAVEARRRTER